jgi:hypothetical protein
MFDQLTISILHGDCIRQRRDLNANLLALEITQPPDVTRGIARGEHNGEPIRAVRAAGAELAELHPSSPVVGLGAVERRHPGGG